MSRYELRRRPYVDVPAGWGERWRAAKAAAGTRLVRAAVISDSTGSGIFADDHDFAWPGLLRTGLQARLGDGGSGWLDWSNSTAGGFGGPGGPNGQDTTETGAWTDVANGVNGLARRPTVDSNGATMTFHPRGTTLDIVSRTDPAFGRYDHQIDGGAVVQVPQNLAAAVSTVSVPVGTGSHTVILTAANLQCRIHGVRGRNGTGVILDNFSRGGRTIASTGGLNSPLNAAAEGLAGQTTLSTSFDVMAPLDLLIFALAVNDVPNGSITNFDTIWQVLGQTQREIRAAGINTTTPPEVVVVLQHVSGFGDDANPYKASRVVSIVREWAAINGAAVVDLWGLGRYSAEYGDSLGWWGLPLPDVHPTRVGHAAFAAPILELLT